MKGITMLVVNSYAIILAQVVCNAFITACLYLLCFFFVCHSTVCFCLAFFVFLSSNEINLKISMRLKTLISFTIISYELLLFCFEMRFLSVDMIMVISQANSE